MRGKIEVILILMCLFVLFWSVYSSRAETTDCTIITVRGVSYVNLDVKCINGKKWIIIPDGMGTKIRKMPHKGPDGKQIGCKK